MRWCPQDWSGSAEDQWRTLDEAMNLRVAYNFGAGSRGFTSVELLPLHNLFDIHVDVRSESYLFSLCIGRSWEFNERIFVPT
jgi:hypothetical protein